MDDYLNRQPPWSVERGSSLCQWNVSYYFLKFKNPQNNSIMMHWNLPDGMSKQLAELKATLATPEAQQGLYYTLISRRSRRIDLLKSNSNRKSWTKRHGEPQLTYLSAFW